MKKTPPNSAPFFGSPISFRQHSHSGGISREEIFLKQVRNCIFSNISNKSFNAVTLARMVNLSVSQLNRKLKTLTGKSSGKLIREIRLYKAARLLEADADTVGNIAYQTGFCDQAHFCRAFKQFFKCSPSKFALRQERRPLLVFSF